MTCTVLVVDDHAEFRSVVRALLQAEGFDVVGEAADAQEALDCVIRLRPEVVLVDVLLPGLDGFAVADQLAATGRQYPTSSWSRPGRQAPIAGGW